MMQTQIEKLRVEFETIDHSQKRQFLIDLRKRASGNAEYARFLNECIRAYNRESGRIQTAVEPGTVHIAKLRVRLIAGIIDILYYGLPTLIFYLTISRHSAIIDGITPAMVTISEWELIRRQQRAVNVAFSLIILIYIFFMLFSFLRCCNQGASWGKKRMSLYVVSKNANAGLSFGLMFIRETIGKLISAVVLLLGFIWMFVDTNNQSWHDKLVSSVVIKSERATQARR